MFIFCQAVFKIEPLFATLLCRFNVIYSTFTLDLTNLLVDFLLDLGKNYFFNTASIFALVLSFDKIVFLPIQLMVIACSFTKM